MKANITLNQDLNGIEISFTEKPEAATIEALKANGYRWHRAKKLWYAKQTPERIALAQSLTGETATAAAATTPATKAEKINLDNLGQNTPSLYGAELAKAIREDLKRRGVKGCTVRARRVTYETGITVTIKATPEDFTSIEEMKLRKPFYEFSRRVESHGEYTGEKWIYTLEGLTDAEKESAYDSYIRHNAKREKDINTHWLIDCRNDYNTFTTAFYNKVVAVFKIANQWNWNRSDSMSDYFDIGYFLDIDIKNPDGFEPREKMSETERADYNAEIEAEEKAREEAFKKYEEERKKAEEEAKKRRAEEEAATAEILGNIQIVDLDEQSRVYITGLMGGIGKEASLTELTETIEQYPDRTRQEAEITRKVIFTSREALDKFNNMYLFDWDFMSGKGGTGSEDIRVKDYKTFQSLTAAQRETVKFYNADCIGVYFNEELQLVIDPEGFNYARYTFLPSEESEITNAAETLKAQEEESKSKPAFYIPEPVADQAAALHEGQAVTIYQTDGWMLSNIYAGSGIITGFYIGEYAQYKDVLYIELMNRGKTNTVHIRNNKDCLIYEGIKPMLPAEVTKRRINDHMSQLLNADELIPNTYQYYLEQGQQPIIDTCHR